MSHRAARGAVAFWAAMSATLCILTGLIASLGEGIPAALLAVAAAASSAVACLTWQIAVLERIKRLIADTP